VGLVDGALNKSSAIECLPTVGMLGTASSGIDNNAPILTYISPLG
jgi:hypothetical protein